MGQLRRRYCFQLAVTVNTGSRRSHVLQCFKSALRPVLLDKSQQSIEKNDYYNCRSVVIFAEKDGNDRCSEKYKHHYILELSKKNFCRTCFFLLGKTVFTVLTKPLCSLRRG